MKLKSIQHLLVELTGFVFIPPRRVYKRRYKKRYKNMLLFWGFMLVKKVFVFFGKKQLRNPI